LITNSGAYHALAPQAFAETSPQFYESYHVPRLGYPLETAFASYGQLYRSQLWVHAAVNKVANSVARLPIKIWDYDDTETKTLDKTSPYAKLMRRPCVTMPNYAFKQWIAATIEIYGETYLLKLREGRGSQVTSLLPMHPSMTMIHRDEYGVELYRFLGRPNEMFTEADVIPFRLYNPDTSMRGLSRLEALRSTLMEEDSSRRAMQAWWQNRMRPSMILRAKRELGKDGRERLERALSSRHGGSGNTGRAIILENDEFEEPNLIQSSAEDMQYIQARQLAREEVCAGMDLPPTALQDMTRATFSNVVENQRSLYRDSITPRVEFIESVFDYYVGSIEFNGDKEAKFDMKHVMRGDWEKRAAAHAQMVQTGVEELAEAREDMDLPDAGPLSHQLYAQMQMVPLDPKARAALMPPPVAPPVAKPIASSNAPAASSNTNNTEKPASTNVQKYMRDISGLIGRNHNLADAAEIMVRKTGDRDGVKEAFEFLLDRQL
jgi:HK97 family phage portal protein